MVGDTIRTTLARNKKAISYQVAGQTISGTIYYPKSNEPAPAVLLLPTAMGLTPHEHAMAARLAREGFTTLALGYTRRTTGALVKNERLRTHLEQVVTRGWHALLADTRSDKSRAAVIGFSLGGYFAVYLGTALKELAPKAVVVYYGMYALAGSELKLLRAPLLLLQAEDDDDDFVASAKRVQELAARDEKPWEVVFYPGTGHQFDLFEPRGAATRDAWERTVRLLRQHLEPSTLKAADKTEAL